MHERDEYLIELVRDTLGLRNTIYNYDQRRSDGWKRGRKAVLMVREYESLRDVVVPLFYKKLRGNKGTQFMEWLENIGNDRDVPWRYKEIYDLYKSSFYDSQNKYP